MRCLDGEVLKVLNALWKGKPDVGIWIEMFRIVSIPKFSEINEIFKVIHRLLSGKKFR